jgi:hypothetical protein
MDTLRVSATDIDALRFYLSPPVEEMQIDLDELLRRLRKQEPPTPAMLAGTAFHKALETAEPGMFDGFAIDGYMFSFETDAELDLPAIREMKLTREYTIDGCEVTLVGKVDGIHGKRVDDHKLTEKYDAEKYLESHQWRVYLEVFHADEFRWNIFEAKESAPRHYLIRAVHQLTANRYPGIGEAVERELHRFVAFARDHLPERVIPAASVQLAKLARA